MRYSLIQQYGVTDYSLYSCIHVNVLPRSYVTNFTFAEIFILCPKQGTLFSLSMLLVQHNHEHVSSY